MSRRLEWNEDESNTNRLRRVYDFLNMALYEIDNGKIENIKLPMEIAFVKMAEKGEFDETTINEHKRMFLSWQKNVDYANNAIVRYNVNMKEKLYKCIQAHTSQEEWEPDSAPALWKEIGISPSGIPEWSQPISVGDAYNIGDEVMYKDVHYRSTINNNVWSPEAYPQGWEVVE